MRSLLNSSLMNVSAVGQGLLGKLRKLFGIMPSGSGGLKLFPLTTGATCLTIQQTTGAVMLSCLDVSGTGIFTVSGSAVSANGAASGGWDARSGTGFSTRSTANHFAAGAGSYLKFYSNNDVFSGSEDASIGRIAAAVLKTATSGGTGCWLQQTGARARNTAAVTNTGTTLASLSDLSLTLVAGRKYFGELRLFVNDATAADGLKIDLNGGTATMTSIEFGISEALGATVGTRTSTALATAVTLTALPDTNDLIVTIPITLVCNAAGTFIPRQAKNSDAGGATLTVRAGSYLWLEDSPN